MADDTPTSTQPPDEGYDSAALARALDAVHAVPDFIGRYRVLEMIGSGGMGEVYVAEQTQPIRRRVALKVIKAGMDTKQVIARFEAERQALAIMDHPNVARVYDAGTTETGRPYFVMELIRGTPITRYCDDAKLTTRQRVELLVPVCQAVQHAHQKGIIHRDLKPNNVLVTLHDGKPMPKVIDFGIAKATTGRLTDKTVYTELRQMIGTPAYMSPEQAEMSGLDVDTRSDIYSLGVLAYELLTGSTPFDTERLIKAGLAEVGRIIKEEDPPPPSSRLSASGGRLPSIAALRGTEPGRIGKLLAGELDWIVMKAMEKDRRRRYDSASDLAADIERHLAGEPVVAAPPGLLYRATKIAGRHKGLIVGTAALIAMLVAATAVSAAWAVRAYKAETLAAQQRDEATEQKKAAQEARALAEQRERESAATVNFLLKDVLAHATPFDMPDPAVRAGVVRYMLDPAADSARRRFADQPQLQASVLMAIGNVYSFAGYIDRAGGMFKEAAALYARLDGPDTEDALWSTRQCAAVLSGLGKFLEAYPTYVDVLARRRRVFGNDQEDTILAIVDLGEASINVGRYAEALSLTQEAVDHALRTQGEGKFATIQALEAQGKAMQQVGRHAEAYACFARALAGKRRMFGDTHVRTIESLAYTATALAAIGRYDEALVMAKRSADEHLRMLGGHDRRTMQAQGSYADLLCRLKRFGQAEPLYTSAIDNARLTFGDGHPQTQSLLDGYAGLLVATNRAAQAEPMARSVFDAKRAVYGDGSPVVAGPAAVYAAVLRADGRAAEADTIAAAYGPADVPALMPAPASQPASRPTP